MGGILEGSEALETRRLSLGALTLWQVVIGKFTGGVFLSHHDIPW